MRYYELLYIVNPNLEDDRIKNIIDEIGNEINKYKVSIINHYLWGKKRLAYPINRNKYGIYLLLQFGTEQFDYLKGFERFLILDKSVIRHQLVRLDEEPTKVENIEPIDDEKELEKDESPKTPDDETKVDLNVVEDTVGTKDEKNVMAADNVDVEESDSKQAIKPETKEDDE